MGAIAALQVTVSVSSKLYTRYDVVIMYVYMVTVNVTCDPDVVFVT